MKNNRLFNAIGSIDERHIREDELADIAKLEDLGALKKRKPIKLRVVLIAAAAAALVLMVGAASRANGTFLFGYNDEYEHGFTFDLHSNEYTVPEECEPEPGKTYYEGRMDMPASELVKKFELPMLINENFSDIEAKIEKEKTWVLVSFSSRPGGSSASFGYYLRDNIIDKKVHFYTTYYLNTNGMKLTWSTHLTDGEPYEIIRLNNGSRCLVTDFGADFSYYGALFSFTLPDDEPEGYEDWTWDEQAAWQSEQPIPGIDTVKQVLADLGLL